MQTALLKYPNRGVPALDRREITLIVLEDVELDRWRLRRYCAKSGLKVSVSEAETIEDFRRQLDARRYDIAFVDYFLPEGSGFDAMEALGAHPDQTGARPILITGLDRAGLAEEARRYRCTCCLNKGDLSADLVRYAITSALTAPLGDAAHSPAAPGAAGPVLPDPE